MNTHGVENSRARGGSFGAGAVRRRSVLRHLMLLAAFLGAAGHLAAPERALADDFDLLLQGAGNDGTVSALVTGWRAITGDEPSLGSRGEGMVAITGDEFVKKLEGASTQVSVTRRYENFPVIAMEMDAQALKAAKTQGGRHRDLGRPGDGAVPRRQRESGGRAGGVAARLQRLGACGRGHRRRRRYPPPLPRRAYGVGGLLRRRVPERADHDVRPGARPVRWGRTGRTSRASSSGARPEVWSGWGRICISSSSTSRTGTGVE